MDQIEERLVYLRVTLQLAVTPGLEEAAVTGVVHLWERFGDVRGETRTL